jgi:hypothetical protein
MRPNVSGAPAPGMLTAMSSDDDDWVGTPPEGHYTADRARPDFWWRQKPIAPAFAGIVLVGLVVLLVLVLR